MIKVAFIGAGSIGFTRRLMHDLLAVPELYDTRFAFTDIDARNLEMVTTLCRRDIAANRLPATVEATPDRRAAVADADYIFCAVRVGGLEAFQTDIDIPLKYGVDQCVGDTLCAGGIMYAQRGIACMLDFCRDIREVAKPGALLMNYANPMAMNTWACLKHGGIDALGLCHGVHGGHEQLRNVIELLHNHDHGHAPGDSGYEKIDLKEVDIVCAGINHQTWYTQVRFRGDDWCPRLLAGFEAHPEYSRTEKVRIDVLRRFGYYSTESNGHLSEYLPWYRKRPEEIGRWIDTGCWINGETGGYLRVCLEGRNWFETDFPNLMQAEPPVLGPDNRSHEHGSWIIEARETGRVYRGHFNVLNRGIITNLPSGCVVEVPGYVDRNGIGIPVVGDLPMACAASCAASVRVQEMAMEAAVRGDLGLLKLAMLHDPLVGAVCNPEEIWQMTDEMLVAQAPWLPQYAAEIPAAAERLRDPVVATRTDNRGAARLAVKTVAEMQANAEQARQNALAADKAVERPPAA
jgi:alpha-galactosidase